MRYAVTCINRVLLCILALLALSGAGCSKPTTENSAAPPAAKPAATATNDFLKPPPFQGTPAGKPIDFDLSGTWKVFRHDGPEKASKLGRWETQWQLRQCPNDIWEDEHTLTRLYLISGDGSSTTPRVPQTLMWNSRHGKRWFFINECRSGILRMTDNDGELYMAIRSD